MRILVTGGAGYIGSVTCEHLVADGHQVIALDNLIQGHRAAVPPGAQFVHADLADAQAVSKIIQTHRPHAIMHFASRSIVSESMEQPFLYLGENISNGLNLLQAACQVGVSKFILSSTASLFDADGSSSIDEAAPILPGSPYGESKFILERMLHWLEQTRGMRYAALRYFNAAGATATRGEHHDPETHLIPLVLQTALGQRAKITVYGDDYPTPDGTCIRDYVHVSDIARAHILCLDALDGRSRVYNVGSGAGSSVREVVETARQITGRPIPTCVAPRRPGDVPRLVANSARITAELGWRPEHTSLATIVQSAWDWHLSHPKGYS